MLKTHGPIGILDSGVGGLSIVRAIKQALPYEALHYVADQAHIPYGPRPLPEIRQYVTGIARYLRQHDAKIIVVACNAASAASLHHLRTTFPEVPFVGMEPAVKPAAGQTGSGVVGVLTTAATADGPLYASVRARFAADVDVETIICPELVWAVEHDERSIDHLRPLFDEKLRPVLDRGADQIVLACTHFPFVTDALNAYLDANISVVDPSPAIARQVKAVLSKQGHLLSHPAPLQDRYLTTGDTAQFDRLANALLELNTPSQKLHWNETQNTITEA